MPGTLHVVAGASSLAPPGASGHPAVEQLGRPPVEPPRASGGGAACGPADPTREPTWAGGPR
eukprot:8749075-Alexandrium_andersonii.AAC.1